MGIDPAGSTGLRAGAAAQELGWAGGQRDLAVMLFYPSRSPLAAPPPDDTVTENWSGRISAPATEPIAGMKWPARRTHRCLNFFKRTAKKTSRAFWEEGEQKPG